MRLLLVLTLAVLIGAIGIATSLTRGAVQQPLSVQQGAAKKPKRIIDGANEPNSIPDRAAYLLLFRMIANHRGDADKNRIRAYLRQIGLGEQTCRSSFIQTGNGDDDINAVLAVAEEFQQKVGELDRQAKEIKDQSGSQPDANAMARLTQLQRQKEAIVDELVKSLPKRLSVGGVERVRKHVSEHMKQKMKMAVDG